MVKRIVGFFRGKVVNEGDPEDTWQNRGDATWITWSGKVTLRDSQGLEITTLNPLPVQIDQLQPTYVELPLVRCAYCKRQQRQDAKECPGCGSLV